MSLRCAIVVDRELPIGRSANAAAVVALTIGRRHPALVGEGFLDACGVGHPGLIPIGITVLMARPDELREVREQGILHGCDVVDFPVQGQQTTDYEAFRRAVSGVSPDSMDYVAVGLTGPRKVVTRIVGRLSLLK